MNGLQSIAVVSAFSLSLFQFQSACGSQESIGPNGINSSALALTGSGVDIGQRIPSYSIAP